ncbi:thiamine pyrophosphate-binding protein [bacterium]|nr:thiamine pyrophosphate-binding protein [bacterium]
MTQSGGEVIASILKNHHIPCIFTLCGGHISPILVASKAAGIRIIDVRDEANAAFAADAFARLTGIPGVAVVTAGPGVTNTVTPLKNAQMAQSPLVLFGGAAATIIKGRGSLQDIDQVSLLQSIVKLTVTINQNCDLVPVIEHAFQVAQSGTPGPVFVECPIDLLYSEEMVREWYGAKPETESGMGIKSKLYQFYLDRHVNRMFACDYDAMQPAPEIVTAPGLKPERVAKAVRLLKKTERPVLIIGSQAMLRQAEVEILAQTVAELGIPVYLAGMARGLLGRSHRLHMRHRRGFALKQADLVLLAGMPCDFRLGYGRSINSKATLVSVNRSKADLNLNRKPELGVLADPCDFLIALGTRFENSSNRFEPWIQALADSNLQREQEISATAAEKTDFINPLAFLKQLDAFLDDNCLIVADGGDFVATASYIMQPRSPLSWLDPGVFGTLGVGAGFALGARLSRPDKEIWLIYGDGAAGYSLQEMDTFVRHGLPVIAVVGNDGSWAQIARDQVEVLNDDVGTVLNRTAYHQVVEGFGGRGFLLEAAEQIPAVLAEARDTARKGIPVLINVLIGKTDFRKGSISM